MGKKQKWRRKWVYLERRVRIKKGLWAMTETKREREGPNAIKV